VIYVNERHRDVHYRTIATDISKLVPSPDAKVLDYGCGEATSANLVAEAWACGEGVEDQASEIVDQIVANIE